MAGWLFCISLKKFKKQKFSFAGTRTGEQELINVKSR